jgi:hypothetical protein
MMDQILPLVFTVPEAGTSLRAASATPLARTNAATLEASSKIAFLTCTTLLGRAED